MRLDLYILQNFDLKSRTYASDAIKEGRVLVNGKTILKPSFDITEEEVVLIPKEVEYVSRGAYKLQSAFSAFQINADSKNIVDIGASTGGFTDFCLKQNAKHVWSVDVGTLQLDPILKEHEKVTCLENTNALNLTKEMVPEPIDLVVMDVSFVSVETLLPFLIQFFDHAMFVVLIKPQFEAGKRYLNKQGIVKDKKVHQQILEHVYSFVKQEGCYVFNMCSSELKGKDGNQEYFIYFSKIPYQKEMPYLKIQSLICHSST